MATGPSPHNATISINRSGNQLLCNNVTYECKRIVSSRVFLSPENCYDAELILRMQEGHEVRLPMASYNNAQTIQCRLEQRPDQSAPVKAARNESGFDQQYWH
jgi:hypothetical protein